ncbi:MAG: helix-turn-helix domain-containing protein [Planctomycetia bacterium]
MAKSQSGEFYSFDEVLRQLNIDEARLKRLVSEGEIRAFREGEQMKFKKSDVAGLAGKGGSDELKLDDISLDEPEIKQKGGMRTAEISSQDTFVDKAGDVGMSTEPIEFTEGGEAEEVEDIGASKPARAEKRRSAPQTVTMNEEPSSPVWSLVLGVTFFIGVAAVLVTLSASRGYANNVSKKLADIFFDGKSVSTTQGS